jgi:hypothetical protein
MPQAQKDLNGFQPKLMAKLDALIMGLYDNPKPHNSKKLT